jgi:hypothetical protein
MSGRSPRFSRLDVLAQNGLFSFEGNKTNWFDAVNASLSHRILHSFCFSFRFRF